MNVRRFLAAVAASVGLAAVAATPASAVPVALDLNALRPIQTYNATKDKPRADDQAYLVLTGVANGKAIEPAKLPKDGVWTTAAKKPAVDPAKPVNVWTGDLGDNEFAVLTVTLVHGKGEAAKIKDYADKLVAAQKPVAALAAPKVAGADDVKAIGAATLKAHRDLVVKIKETFGGKAKNDDHFGGQFTIVVANVGGKVVKRLDPVGLTFGEHYGDGVKTYSKIKLTRQNVFVKDDAGDWTEQQLLPLNDEEDAVRVKMLDAEPAGAGKPKVTDYLAELKLSVGGKAQKWKLGGETLGKSDIHTYWEFAE